MKIKTSRHIFAHIDCDSFFASCEVLVNPKLKDTYVCVGGEIIIAATYNAKRLGVKVGTPVWEAKKILKNKPAHFCGVNMQLYKNISRKLMSYLGENTLDVREFSIDEAFVDISGLSELRGLDLEDYLLSIQQDILENIGIPVSIGVSNTRLKAKIFSKVRKPFGIFVGIDAQREKDIFQTLSFREIPFVGGQSSKKLQHHISYIQDYIQLGYFDIVSRFGKNGGKIWLELRGVSSMSFLPKSVAKSIGRARAFNREMSSDKGVLLKRIQTNVDRLCDELHARGCEIGAIELLIIDSHWNHSTLSTIFPSYSSDRTYIFSVLKEMFLELYRENTLYRKTGVSSSLIQSTNNKQLSIFQHENKSHAKNKYIEDLLHDVEVKYGKGVLRIGV